MEIHFRIFNESYDRAVAPNSPKFFARFYQILAASDTRIEILLSEMPIARQERNLAFSLLNLVSYGATGNGRAGLTDLAAIFGGDREIVPAEFYDVWLACLLETVRELDRRYSDQVGAAWTQLVSPGLEHLRAVSEDPEPI